MCGRSGHEFLLKRIKIVLLLDQCLASVKDGPWDQIGDHTEACLDAKDDKGEDDGAVVAQTESGDNGNVNHDALF